MAMSLGVQFFLPRDFLLLENYDDADFNGLQHGIVSTAPAFSEFRKNFSL